jgi:hypothetical protein
MNEDVSFVHDDTKDETNFLRESIASAYGDLTMALVVNVQHDDCQLEVLSEFPPIVQDDTLI